VFLRYLQIVYKLTLPLAINSFRPPFSKGGRVEGQRPPQPLTKSEIYAIIISSTHQGGSL
jgi:hypothetical protein